MKEEYSKECNKVIQQGRHEGMILGALMSGKTPEEVSKMLNLL